MALATRELEGTLTIQRALVAAARSRAKILPFPKRPAMEVALAFVAAFVLFALVILHAANEDSDAVTLLAVPEDDEEASPEEGAQAAKARAELARGEDIPWESLRDELKTSG